MEDNCFTVLCWFLPLLLFSCSAAASDSLLTPWAVVCEISLSFTVSQSLLKFKPIGSMMPSNHLIFCHLLLLLHLIVPSIRVFSNDWTLHIKWPKYWNFSISPFNEYSGLISCSVMNLCPVQWIIQSWSPVQCYEPLFSGILSTRSNTLNLSLPLYNYKEFDLGHTWVA